MTGSQSTFFLKRVCLQKKLEEGGYLAVSADFSTKHLNNKTVNQIQHHDDDDDGCMAQDVKGRSVSRT